MGDGGNESVAGTAGIWGFLVLFALAIACWLLFRSMNNHLRGVRWRQGNRQEALDAFQSYVLPEEQAKSPSKPADSQ